jgi:hypothetical protein
MRYSSDDERVFNEIFDLTKVIAYSTAESIADVNQPFSTEVNATIPQP